MTLNLHIMATNRTVCNSKVEELILSSESGQIGILPNHSPLVTKLKAGALKMRVNGQWATIALMEGFAQLDNNQVIVVVADAEDTGKVEAPQVQDAS